MAAVRAILSTLSGFAQAGPGAAASRGARSAPPQGAYAHAGPEPRLDELLSDPLIRLLMRADGVDPAELRRLLGLGRETLAT